MAHYSEGVKINHTIIGRLVYNPYGLTEDEIKTIERSVWGDKFEERYEELPDKNEALNLSPKI